MERKILIMTTIAVIAILVVTAVAWYTFSPKPSSTQATDTLVIGTTYGLDSLDPMYGNAAIDYFFNGLVWDFPLQWDFPAGVEVKPRLVTAWTVSSDAKTFSMTVRNDVKFHDNTTLTASDIAYSINYQATHPDTQGGYIWADSLESCVVTDATHFTIKMKSGDVSVLKYLGMWWGGGSIAPKNDIENPPAGWGRTVLVGSGPYKFVEWLKEERIVLVRNDEYWGTKPAMKNIVIKFVADPTTARFLLENGEIDIFYGVPTSTDLPALASNSKLFGQNTPSGYVRWLSFNQRNPAVADLRVREAIAYAIDRDRLLSDGYKNDGIKGDSLINTFITPYYDPVFAKYVYNVTKARQLLAQAGYANGLNLKLLWNPEHYDSLERDGVTLLQDMLAEVNITTTPIQQDWASFKNTFFNTLDWDLSLNGWTLDFPDPHNTFTQPLMWIRNSLNWSWPARFEELVNLGITTSDVNTRKAYYDEAQQIVGDQLPVFVIKQNVRHIYANNWVKNFTLTGNTCADQQSIQYAYIEKP